MMLLAALAVTTAFAAESPTVAVSTGSQLWVTDDCASGGMVGRGAVLWKVGSVELGPTAQVSTNNYCFYQGGGNAFGDAPGDFTLLSVGPEVSAPTLVEGRTVRLGLRGTVLVERYRVAMEESAYQEEVLPELGGIEPKNGLRGVLFRPSVGLDAAFALASRRPAPEFVFSLDAGYNTGFGVVVTPSLGLRVGAGG